jgi:uncharacterized protein (DUF1684 family)
MKPSLSFFVILPITILFYSCNNENLEQKGSLEYIAEVEQWHQKRIEKLKDKNGWLTIVGLYWLKEGENTFGSDKSNYIVFPENAPKKIGTITLKDSVITLKVNDVVNVTNDGNPVKEIILQNDLTSNPTILDLGSLRWYIIKREDKIGIRLRDTESDLRKEFEGIEKFPVNDDWQLEAKFEVYNPLRTISLPTQLGTVVEQKSPGAAVFIVNDKEYRLDAIDTGKRYWFIFADETNGKETYGAGRYLYMDKPDSLGNMTIDFNYAYNPPCVFTKYATCSFAPKQNHLRLKITAGEKMWEKYH